MLYQLFFAEWQVIVFTALIYRKGIDAEYQNSCTGSLLCKLQTRPANKTKSANQFFAGARNQPPALQEADIGLNHFALKDVITFSAPLLMKLLQLLQQLLQQVLRQQLKQPKA